MSVITADSQIRDQLKRIKDQLSDLRTRRAEAKRERDEAKQAFAGVDFSPETKITETAEFKAAEEAVKRLGDLDDEIESHRQSESALLRLIGEAQDATGNGHTPAPPAARAIGWNAGRMLAESEVYKDARARGVFTSHSKFGALELGSLADRDQVADFLRSRSLSEAPGGTASLPNAPAGIVGSATHGALLRPDYRGIVEPRLPTLLDVFPTGTTDASVVEYVQVTAIPGTAAIQAEGQPKAQQGITFTDQQANVVTIAGWIKVNRQAMDDMAGLSAMINTLLPYDVRRKVIGQILTGSGAAGQIRGIYNTTGVGVGGSEDGDNIADAFLRAMTVVILSDSEPNFAALHPLVWQDLLLMKTEIGNYIYGSPGQLPGGMVAQTVWGLTLTSNPFIDPAKPLVGDAMGAMILVREGVNVRASDSDADDFTRNRTTVLAETRIAFPVWRPSAFATVTLPGAAE